MRFLHCISKKITTDIFVYMPTINFVLYYISNHQLFIKFCCFLLASNPDDPEPDKRNEQLSELKKKVNRTSPFFTNNYHFGQTNNFSLPSTNYSDTLYNIKQTYCKKKIRRIRN